MASPKRSQPSRKIESKTGNGPTTRRGLIENEIYEHATRLFADRGFAGTTLQDIADALGVTRPALYYYFKSKDEILAKLVHEITETSAEDLHEIARQDPASATVKLRAIAYSTASRIAVHADRFRLLVMSEAELPQEIARAHLEARRAVLAVFIDVLEEGIRSGEFRPIDARTAALGILGTCNWVAWWHRPGDDVDAVADTLADMAVASVARAEHRRPEVEGPAGVLSLMREDIAHLEQLLGTDSARTTDGKDRRRPGPKAPTREG